MQLQRGLLIEADPILLGSLPVFLDACRARLAKEQVKLDQGLFVRFLFGRPLTRGLNALLEKQGKSAEAAALAADCNAAYLAALQGAKCQPPEGLALFIKEMAGRGVRVGLITQLGEDAARQSFADLLEERVVTVSEPTSGVCMHGWEGWRRACRKMQLRERLCVAISSPASSRGALAAAMRVVVVANPLQEHVDCSGADIMTDSFSPAIRTAAQALLKLK